MGVYKKQNKIKSFLNSWRYDYILILWMTVILFTVASYTVAKVWIEFDKETTAHKIELIKAKTVNDDMNACIELCKTLNLKLLTDNDKKLQKQIYTSKELDFQRERLEKVHKQIAEKIAPYGTCVYLKDFNEYCFVEKCEGLYAHTREDIMFNVTDFDTYYTVSQRDYYIYKKYKGTNLDATEN